MGRWIKEDKESEAGAAGAGSRRRPRHPDVTLYDARGIPSPSRDQAVPLDSLLPIGTDNKSLPEQGKGRIQFVQEILRGT